MIITEIRSGGSVSALKLLNNSANIVLVADGEELMGAKQNRTANTSESIAATQKHKKFAGGEGKGGHYLLTLFGFGSI